MYKVKNRRHRPFYKKFISLRTNVQYRRRLSLLKFKKQKWEKLISYLKRSMNRSRYNFRAYDLNKRNLPRYYNPFKRKYKNILQNKKRISLFYGNLLVKYLKKQVSLVINFDIPRFKETYIHRIGRSGRFGRKGVAINFVSERDFQQLKRIEEYYSINIESIPKDIKNILSS